MSAASGYTSGASTNVSGGNGNSNQIPSVADLNRLIKNVDGNIDNLRKTIEENESKRRAAANRYNRAHEKIRDPGPNRNVLKLEMESAIAEVDSATTIINDCTAKHAALLKNRQMLEQVRSGVSTSGLDVAIEMERIVTQYSDLIDSTKNLIDETNTNYGVMLGAALEQDETFTKQIMQEEDLSKYDAIAEKMQKIANGEI